MKFLVYEFLALRIWLCGKYQNLKKLFFTDLLFTIILGRVVFLDMVSSDLDQKRNTKPELI